MRFRSLVATLVWLPALAAPAVADDEDEPDVVLAEIGAGEFQTQCAPCHGVGGHGDGPVAPELKRGPSDLTRIAARRGGRFPAGEIARFIDGRFDVPAHGTREMPVWGNRLAEDIPETELAESVTRGKIAAIVEYLKTIQRPLVEPD